MTITQFADRLGVSRMTLSRMRKSFELPPTIPTSRRFVRWLDSDVDLWFELGCPSTTEFEALKRTKRKFARK